MGYCSYYTLSFENVTDEKEQEKLIAELRAECEEAEYAFDSEGNPPQETKWYDSDEDMLKFSLKHPEVIFCMYRMGDEWDDVGYTYYKNGKMQQCPAIITFAPYDETKLVEPIKSETV